MPKSIKDFFAVERYKAQLKKSLQKATYEQLQITKDIVNKEIKKRNK